MAKSKLTGLQITGIAVLVIVAVIASSLVLIPGLMNSIATFITGEETLCGDAPYNPNCACTIDREKVQSWFKFACISHSPKISTDCDWCAGNCVEWRKIWEQYPSALKYNNYCDPRTAVLGYACIARRSEFGGMECAAVPSIHTEGFSFFCNSEAIREVVTEWQGTNGELLSFFSSTCPIPGTDPRNNCPLSYYGNCYASPSAPSGMQCSVECRSNCNGAGLIAWNIVWDANDRSYFIGQPSAGVHTVDCIDGV